MPLFEEEFVRFLAVNPVTRRLHLLMPLVSGEVINLDNSCEVFRLLRLFFGLDLDSTLESTPIYKILLRYQEALNIDIGLLRVTAPLRKEKEARLQDVSFYIEILRQLYAMPGIISSLQEDAFPPPLRTLLSNAENLYSMLLIPNLNQADFSTKPVFSFESNSILGPRLYRTLQRIHITHPHQGVKYHIIQRVLKRCERESIDSKKSIQDVLHEEVHRALGVSIPFQDAGATFVMSNSDTSPSVYISYIERLLKRFAPNLFETVVESPFHRVNDNEDLIRVTLFFLGYLNIYCKMHELSNSNFGQVLNASEALCRRFIYHLARALEADQPERILFQFFNRHPEHFGIQTADGLNAETCATITKDFLELFATIRDSTHFNEFVILDTKRPGKFLTHQGNICIDVAEFFKATLSYLNQPIPEALEAVCESSKLFPRSVPHQNILSTGDVDSTEIDGDPHLIYNYMKARYRDQRIPLPMRQWLSEQSSFFFQALKEEHQEDIQFYISAHIDKQALLRTPQFFTDLTGFTYYCTPFEYAYWKSRQFETFELLASHMSEDTKEILFTALYLEKQGILVESREGHTRTQIIEEVSLSRRLKLPTLLWPRHLQDPTELLSAVKSGNLAQMEALLARFPNKALRQDAIVWFSKHPEALLMHHVAELPQPMIGQMLLEHLDESMRIECLSNKNKDGQTPLQQWSLNVTQFSLLFEALPESVRISQLLDPEHSVLHQAMQLGQLTLIETIFEKVTKPELDELLRFKNSEGMELLHCANSLETFAAMKKYYSAEELVDIILRPATSASAPKAFFETALERNPQWVRMLLSFLPADTRFRRLHRESQGQSVYQSILTHPSSAPLSNLFEALSDIDVVSMLSEWQLNDVPDDKQLILLKIIFSRSIYFSLSCDSQHRILGSSNALYLFATHEILQEPQRLDILKAHLEANPESRKALFKKHEFLDGHDQLNDCSLFSWAYSEYIHDSKQLPLCQLLVEFMDLEDKQECLRSVDAMSQPNLSYCRSISSMNGWRVLVLDWGKRCIEPSIIALRKRLLPDGVPDHQLLKKALEENDAKTFEALLRQYPTPTSRADLIEETDDTGMNLFFQAAQSSSKLLNIVLSHELPIPNDPRVHQMYLHAMAHAAFYGKTENFWILENKRRKEQFQYIAAEPTHFSWILHPLTANGVTLLHLAAKSPNPHLFQQFFSDFIPKTEHHSVLRIRHHHQTLLHLAASASNPKTFQAVLHAYPKEEWQEMLLKKTSSGLSVLHIAAIHASFQIFSMAYHALPKDIRRSSLFQKTKEGENVIQYALKGDDYDTLRLIANEFVHERNLSILATGTYADYMEKAATATMPPFPVRIFGFFCPHQRRAQSPQELIITHKTNP